MKWIGAWSVPWATTVEVHVSAVLSALRVFGLVAAGAMGLKAEDLLAGDAEN